jgi:WD40 repeat protein
MQVVHEPPVPVLRLQPRLPRDLATICMKCLEKEPRGRYPTAAELADDLRRFLDGQPIRARPVGLAGRLNRWGRRNPALAGMLTLLGLVVASAAAIVVREWRSEVRARIEAEALARSEGEAQAEAKRARLAAERARVGLIVDRGLALCEKGEVGPGLLWLAQGLAVAEAARADESTPAIRANLAAWSARLLIPHTSPPQGASTMSVAFSPDGRYLLSGAWDSKWAQAGPGEAQVWSPQDWKPVGPAALHPGPVIAVAFSPDGRRALTGSREGTIRIRDAASGSPVAAIGPLPYRLTSLAVSPDGAWFLTAGESQSGAGAVDRWDAATGLPRGPRLSHRGPVESIAISPDGRHFVTGCTLVDPSGNAVGGEARLWNAATGEPSGPVMMHSDPVRSVAFSPDGTMILTGCDDAMARLWDCKTGQHVGMPQLHAFPVLATAFSPDGRTVVSGGGRTRPLGADQGEIRFWDVVTGELLVGPSVLDTLVHSIAFRPDGRAVATGTRDGQIRIWDTARLRPLREWDRPLPVMALAYSPDGARLMTGGGRYQRRLPGNSDASMPSEPNRADAPRPAGGLAWLDDAGSGGQVAPVLEHSGPVEGVAFSPDGRTIATGTRDGWLRFWSADGRPLGPPLRQGGRVYCLAYHPDNRSLAACGVDARAHVWEVPSGRLLATLAPPDTFVRSVAFSPDGRTIAIGGRDNGVRLFDAKTFEPMAPPTPHRSQVMTVAFSPDGKTLLSGGPGEVRRWDAASLLMLGAPLPHSGTVWTIRFSRDGMRFLTVAGTPYRDFGHVRLWDGESHRPLGPPLPQRVSVTVATFHPAGQLVATGGGRVTSGSGTSPAADPSARRSRSAAACWRSRSTRSDARWPRAGRTAPVASGPSPTRSMESPSKSGKRSSRSPVWCSTATATCARAADPDADSAGRVPRPPKKMHGVPVRSSGRAQ